MGIISVTSQFSFWEIVISRSVSLVFRALCDVFFLIPVSANNQLTPLRVSMHIKKSEEYGGKEYEHSL